MIFQCQVKANKVDGENNIAWTVYIFAISGHARTDPFVLPLFKNSLSQYSDENMMDPYNLAICFGPTLMPVPDIQEQVSCQAHVNEIIKTIIIHHESIFPDAKELEGPIYEKCMAGDDYW